MNSVKEHKGDKSTQKRKTNKSKQERDFKSPQKIINQDKNKFASHKIVN